MKYGLIYYKDTTNIGDDILTYAAKRFLPSVDYYIDREAMDIFLPETDEAVACILNGWYLHAPYTFPPSPYIYPFFIGTHFDANYITEEYEYLDDNVTEYLKRFSPIGCRDNHTKNEMDARNIESYFSGCMTLTVKRPEGFCNNSEIASDIILTDLSQDEIDYIKNRFPDKKIKTLSHNIPQNELFIPWGKEREERVENLLNTYCNTKLVITSRLHASLPCVAMGIPVILIGKYNDDYHRRLEDFAEYVYAYPTEKLLSGELDSLIESIPKAKSCEEIASKLEDICKSFIEKTKNLDEASLNLIPTNLYKELYIDRTLHMKNQISHLVNMANELIHQHEEDVSVMKKMLAIMEGNVN